MKRIKFLVGLALAHFGVPAASTLPPTSVGDSFFSFTYGTSAGPVSGAGLIYLGADGTCRLLSFSTSEFEGPGPIVPTYMSSAAGTYTYSQSTGGTTEAGLAFSFPNLGNLSGYNFGILFTSATAGTSTMAPVTQLGPLALYPGTFTILFHGQNDFLANVSNRVTLRPSDTAIIGFVVQGSGSRLVLVRTIGPALGQFGVSPVSMNPQMNLFLGTGSDQVGSGQPWGSVTGFDAQAMSWIFSMAGAFPLPAGSNDVAYFAVLSPGVYTAQSFDSSTPATGASALTEVYILPYSG